MKKLCFGLVCLMTLSACATYPYAKNVKMISFEDDVSKGKSAGPIRGEDCQWSILGYQMGGAPTLDRAFANARSQYSTGVLDSFGGGKKATGNELRYINNVSTENDGFNAVIFGKTCLVVKGLGYR